MMIADDVVTGYPDPLTAMFEGTMEEWRYQKTYEMIFVCDVCFKDLSGVYDDPDNWSSVHANARVFVTNYQEGYHIELGKMADWTSHIYCNRCGHRIEVEDGYP